MAIITFKSNELKETGQTLSLVAVSVQMAIEHNYKILVMSTNFNDQTLENCFWDLNKSNTHTPLINSIAPPTGIRGQVGIESGVEALTRILVTNRTNPEIVKNYSKIILRDRLDILRAPTTSDYNTYLETAKFYPDILQIANRYYDIILVDVNHKMPKQIADNIAQMSDVVVVNMNQRVKAMNDFMKLRESDDFYKKRNIMLLIGRYDSFSKYNMKNITRYLKEKKMVSVVPYNTLFFEACAEGKIIDFFLRLRRITDEADRNCIFLYQVSNVVNDIMNKLQETQMKI